jgi:hypothetical protein
MPRELPTTLSVNDAAALMLNISYIPGTNDLLEMLSFFREEAESKHDHAKSQDERDKYTAHIAMYLCREGLARSLIQAIDSELSNIRKGQESLLEVVEAPFGSEKLVTSSVCAWAAHMGFGIEGWEPPRFWRKAHDRSYQTEYLAILDDVIATFCEEGGEHYEPGIIPNKAAIKAWVQDKYGMDVSNKVLDVIPTLLRPGITQTTKK